MFTVALVGRTNVGKSALFNRLASSRVAIVDKMPGITRDRIKKRVNWAGKSFMLIDTGGYVFGEKESLIEKIKEQAKKAVCESDLLIFLIDVKEAVTALDREVADIIRKSGKAIILAGNKCDNAELMAAGQTMNEFGFERFYLVSAMHGVGINDLLDDITGRIATLECEEESSIKKCIRLAVVGRPNVGKSTFVNSVLGEERIIVDELPGTTRDSIDVCARLYGHDWTFIDTAGIRKKKKIKEAVEKYSLIRTQNSINHADIVLFIIDALQGIAGQDEHAIKSAKEQGKGCIIAVNKWDLVKGISMPRFEKDLRGNYDVVGTLPICFISALKGDNIENLLKFIIRIYNERNREIKTTELNQFFKKAFEAHEPPVVKGRRLKLYYATQVKTAPPHFVCYVNNPGLIDRGFEQYLINGMKKTFGFEGTPIVLLYRRRR